MSSQSDRNLLIGMLALQMDFVTSEQLIAAMHRWVMDKSSPIDQILIDQKALDATIQPLLDALVTRHQAQHGAASRNHLTAVSSLAANSDETQVISTSALKVDDHSGCTNPSEDSIDVNFQQALTEAAESPTTQGQRFCIRRPHAKGGLGEVFVARDEELKREVALKEIQQEYADDNERRARFLLEAEVTGGLEHPGIVPVYSLGQYEDGRPYYAMRFIKGESLKEAVDHFQKDKEIGVSLRALHMRQLLGRLVDVCQAIEYAHSRGVLHRDLKPENIMLGKFGETLVVDWGLAKAVDRQEIANPSHEETLLPHSGNGSTPTQLGRAIGTPSYMSPEQAAGRVNELGPKSDVYGLGATLYYMLAGRPPFTGQDVGRILQRVESGQFKPPRIIQPSIPRPLDAICLKAMATCAEDRYHSPLELAQDIERYLADEPTIALKESMTLRARRWFRKHPPVIAALVASVVVGLASMFLLNGIVSEKNEQLADVIVDLDVSNRRLATANHEFERSNGQLAQFNRELHESNQRLETLNVELNETNRQLAQTIHEERKAKYAAPQKKQVAQVFRLFLTNDLLSQAGPKTWAETRIDKKIDEDLQMVGVVHDPQFNPWVDSAAGAPGSE